MDSLNHLEVDELVDRIGEVSRRDELLGLVGTILSTQSNLAGMKRYHEYVENALSIAVYAIERVEAKLWAERTDPKRHAQGERS